MDRETAEALLRPWVGDAVLPDLPLPYLVTVRLDRAAPASAVSLSRALAEAGVDATVDDHSLWRREVERAAALITALAVAAFLLTAGAAGAARVYPPQAGVAGAGAAMALVAGLRFLGGAEGVTPALPVAWSDVLMLSPCPLLAATVALVAARITALARLRGGR